MWYNPSTDQQLGTHAEIRAVCSNPTLPAVITDADLALAGFFPVQLTKPVFDAATQVAELAAPELVQGEYVQRWTARPFTQDEVAAHAAAAAAGLAEYMREFRGLRTDLLNVLTGMALAEGFLAEFKVLRQQLLDIPSLPSVVNATTALEAKLAVKAAYAKIVPTAPEAFVRAFKQLDS